MLLPDMLFMAADQYAGEMVEECASDASTSKIATERIVLLYAQHQLSSKTKHRSQAFLHIVV